MSDDTPAGFISLESDDAPAPAAAPDPEPAPAPVAEAVEAEPEPAETPDAPAAEDDEPPDALTSSDGRKYVPISALHREREQAKALKAQLEQPRPLSPAEQRQLESARYIAEQLQNRPDIVAALQSGQPLTREQQRTVDRVEATAPVVVPPPVAEFTPDELREVAELQGYYTAEGAPDLKAAEKYLGILDRRAAKLADSRVQPLILREQTVASDRQVEHIAQMAADMGVSPEDARPVLRELAKANPQLMAESAEYGLAGVIFAAGIQALQQRTQQRHAPPPAAAAQKPEPLLVERSIGPARTPPVSAADRARAKQYGISPKAYEHTAQLLDRAAGATIVFDED